MFVSPLHVYPGNGKSWLYEDDGHTWAFQEGETCLTHLNCSTQARQGSTHPARIRIERTPQGPFTPTYDRIQVVVHGIRDAPLQAHADDVAVAPPVLDASARTLTLNTGLFRTVELCF